MLVLALDTSSPAVTVGIVAVTGEAMQLLAVRSTLAARGHGELLTPSIAECLDDAGRRPRELQAVVAGTGPGPFTGLRVGLVTAAALADALAVPAYGVCSLDAIAAAAADEPALLVVTDARRREVYHARYAHGRRTGEPAVDRPEDVPLGALAAVAGAGIALSGWPGLRQRPERHPGPLELVGCALPRLLAGSPGEVLTPLYLRRPDAVVPGAPKAVHR